MTTSTATASILFGYYDTATHGGWNVESVDVRVRVRVVIQESSNIQERVKIVLVFGQR
jgi:hypothetical protein